MRLHIECHCCQTYNQIIVWTATFSTLKMAANLTQTHNVKHDFHKELNYYKCFGSVLTMVNTVILSAHSKTLISLST